MAITSVGIGSPRHGDDAGAGLDEPPSQEHALPVDVATVGVAAPGRFTFNLKGALRVFRGQKIESLA